MEEEDILTTTKKKNNLWRLASLVLSLTLFGIIILSFISLDIMSSLPLLVLLTIFTICSGVMALRKGGGRFIPFSSIILAAIILLYLLVAYFLQYSTM